MEDLQYEGLPPDDALVLARKADLALADRIEAEARRQTPPHRGDFQGPTAAWRWRHGSKTRRGS